MSKIGPKELQRRSLRERQKRPQQRVKARNGGKAPPKVPEATPEVAKALRYYRQRLKTARVYQRGYYARNRDRILQQRKERGEKRT